MPEAGTETRVIVTGATGVIGRRVVPALVRRGYQVTAVGRTPAARAALEGMGARAIALDLLDRRAAWRALAGQHVTVNLATHIPRSLPAMLLPWAWRENDRLRRDGAAALVAAALEAGVTRFVQESFAPVYADGGDRWIDEAWPQRPAPNNRTVLDAEAAAGRFTRAGGTGVVLRFAGFYGPDAFLRALLGMVRRGWSPLPGPPGAYWSSISQRDAAAAVVAALAVPEGTYNVSDEAPLTRREWGEALAAAAGLPPPRPAPAWLARLGGRRVEVLSRSQRISSARLRAASGWAPQDPSAREGLRAAVAALDDATREAREAGAEAGQRG
jgi:2-alkyl-3-oxoalkanoate reductase